MKQVKPKQLTALAFAIGAVLSGWQTTVYAQDDGEDDEQQADGVHQGGGRLQHQVDH